MFIECITYFLTLFKPVFCCWSLSIGDSLTVDGLQGAQVEHEERATVVELCERVLRYRHSNQVRQRLQLG